MKPDDTMQVDNDEIGSDRGLPFPKVMQGKIEVEHLDIDYVDRLTLQNWCRAYGLSCTGTKDMMKGRLRVFSSNCNEWEKFVPKARRTHRGAQIKMTGISTSIRRTTTTGKQSARRAADIFENREAQPLPHMPLALPSRTPVQTVTQRAAILEWAQSAVVKHQYVNKKAREEAAKARLTSHNNSTATQASNTLLELANAKLSNIEAGMSLIAASASVQAAGVSTPTNQELDPTPVSVHSALSMMNKPDLVNSAHATASPTSSLLRSLVLAGGIQVEFTAADVPPPPSMSFVSDIPLLNSMWDDTSTYWRNYSILELRGIYIPIIYWKEIYSRRPNGGGSQWKPKHWQSIKNHYSKWQLLITRFRKGTEDNFWREFTDKNGNRMTYTAISRCLQEIRAREDSELAARARIEYRSDFEDCFSYKKGGQVYVKTKDTDIARQYRKMTDMDDYGDDVDEDC